MMVLEAFAWHLAARLREARASGRLPKLLRYGPVAAQPVHTGPDGHPTFSLWLRPLWTYYRPVQPTQLVVTVTLVGECLVLEPGPQCCPELWEYELARPGSEEAAVRKVFDLVEQSL